MAEKIKINSEVLKWARNSMGMSIDELSAKTKIKPSLLQLFEVATDFPSFSQLRKISIVLKRPSATFFMTKIPEDPQLPRDFRVLDEADIFKLAPKTIFEIRKAQRKREIAVELSYELGREIKRFEFKASLKNEPEKLAEEFRKKILGTKPIDFSEFSDGQAFEFWTDKLKNLGIIVFQASLSSLDEMRALTVYNTVLPMILLNTKDSPRGKIFSLLHEFCHVLLHSSGIGNIDPNWNIKNINPIEVFCNAFAGYCILPNEELFKNETFIAIKNGKINIERLTLQKIANTFRVSWEVALRRLLDLKMLSDGQYKNLRIEIKEYYKSKKQTKAIVPHEKKILNYNGIYFTNLVLESFYHERISAKNVSDYLGVRFQHLDKIQKRLQFKKGA